MTARQSVRFERFTTPGEAETWDCMMNGDFDAAFAAAATTGAVVRVYEGEAWDWFERAWQDDAIVALEQCCEDGSLLRSELREARLTAFPLCIRCAAEQWLREVPPSLSDDLLRFIYWFVRIERAERTDNPVFDPGRSLTVKF